MIEAYATTRKHSDDKKSNEDGFKIFKTPCITNLVIVDGAGNSQRIAHHVIMRMTQFLNEVEPHCLVDWRRFITQLDMEMLNGPQATMAVASIIDHGSFASMALAIVGDCKAYVVSEDEFFVYQGRKERLGSGRAMPIVTYEKLNGTLILMTDGCWVPLTKNKILNIARQSYPHMSDMPEAFVNAAGFSPRLGLSWADDCTCAVAHINTRLQSSR